MLTVYLGSVFPSVLCVLLASLSPISAPHACSQTGWKEHQYILSGLPFQTLYVSDQFIVLSRCCTRCMGAIASSFPLLFDGTIEVHLETNRFYCQQFYFRSRPSDDLHWSKSKGLIFIRSSSTWAICFAYTNVVLLNLIVHCPFWHSVSTSDLHHRRVTYAGHRLLRPGSRPQRQQHCHPRQRRLPLS